MVPPTSSFPPKPTLTLTRSSLDRPSPSSRRKPLHTKLQRHPMPFHLPPSHSFMEPDDEGLITWKIDANGGSSEKTTDVECRVNHLFVTSTVTASNVVVAVSAVSTLTLKL
ncbi:unnamed protein product [Lactuca saligna]|uniref:Uncharacterized protein n=1 Tax=Lactuca saligna TaxID=75948 RepID=A0AA35VUB2_LACSI|nr:unnamed protein product [Lactuca saligna]